VRGCWEGVWITERLINPDHCLGGRPLIGGLYGPN